MQRAFLQYIYRRYCKFEEDYDKVNDIEQGVKKIVNEILEQLGKDHSVFTNSKVIGVGSFYEKTKVGAPDEFDFMIVLGNLSLPEAIAIKTGCVPWYKKIRVQNSSDTYTAVFDRDNVLSNTRITEQFWSFLLLMFMKKTFSVRTKYGTINTNGCRNRKLLLKFIAENQLKNLPGNEENNPDSKQLILIPSLNIGVDLMLAIDYPNIEEIVTSEGFPVEWRKWVEKNGCHLVAKTCQSLNPCSTCWHVSLANAESKLMFDMDAKHKQAYQVVKYLLTREVPYSGKCANLSSYMLKNAFLFHTKSENGCVCCQDATVCVHEVFDYLIRSFKVGKMPCFFSRNINTWGPDLKFPVFCNQEGPSGFLDGESWGVEWYALCWLELWCRVVVRADKLVKDVKSPDDQQIQDQFKLMKESMMLIVECYCNYRNIIQSSLSEKDSLPTGISNDVLNYNFEWYFGRLKQSFRVKLDDLIH